MKMKAAPNYIYPSILVVLMSNAIGFANVKASEHYLCTVHGENIAIEADSLSDAQSKAMFRCMVTYKAGTSCYEQITCQRRQTESMLAQVRDKNWLMVVFLAGSGLIGTIGLIGLTYCYCLEKRGSMPLTQDV